MPLPSAPPFPAGRPALQRILSPPASSIANRPNTEINSTGDVSRTDSYGQAELMRLGEVRALLRDLAANYTISCSGWTKAREDCRTRIKSAVFENLNFDFSAAAERIV